MFHTRYTNLASVLLVFVCVAMSCGGAEPKRSESKRFVPETFARFEMVLGRLQLSTEYFQIRAAHERSTLEDGRERTRSVSVSTLRGKPTLQFRDQGGDEEVQLSFKGNRIVDIVLTTGRDGERQKLTYHQPSEGPISVRVEYSDGRSALNFNSRSLWHLAMDEPQAFETYLQPWLSRLEPSWDMMRAVEAIREIMNKSLHQSEAKEVTRLIEQLDAELSADRYAAQSQLESMGIAAEHALRRSLTEELTSQQQASVKRLLNSIQPTSSDTPMRVAVWMSGEVTR